VVDRIRCAKPLQVTRGEVRFERVRFAYGGGPQPVIDDFTLTIRPGEKIGLVGRSGAGKSTLVNLLLRFYDLSSGPHPDRRPGHRRRHPGQPARADRHGHAGHLAAAPLGARQHPLRPPRRRATPT
jgi:energy-coupling factor transporter ATP-binding protein EcfA2